VFGARLNSGEFRTAVAAELMPADAAA